MHVHVYPNSPPSGVWCVAQPQEENVPKELNELPHNGGREEKAGRAITNMQEGHAWRCFDA